MAITPLDEYMCHPTVNTFDHVETSDPQWTERVWFSAFEKTGKYVFAFGMGKYTNRNVMDASVCISVDSKTQYNIRASRELFPDIDTYKVGPMGYEILEPLKKVRVFADDNDYGIKYDLTFIGETEVYQQTPSMFRRRKGRLVNHMIRYFQTGSVEGWIEIEGERIEVKREEWWSSRDRSWGLRSNTGELVTSKGESTIPHDGGMQPAGEGVPYRWSYFTMQFDNWNTSFEFAMTPTHERLGPALGHLQHHPSTGKKDQKIVHVDHHWDFLDDSDYRLKAIRSVIHLDDGSTRELQMEPIGFALRRPGGGGYAGYKGMGQGTWMGQYFIDGEKMDLTEELIDKLHFTDDYALKITCGDETGWGLTEPLIPGVAELLTS